MHIADHTYLLIFLTSVAIGIVQCLSRAKGIHWTPIDHGREIQQYEARVKSVELSASTYPDK